MDKNEKMLVQSLQSYCFCSLNMQICDVLVAVAVVVAKAPYYKIGVTRFGVQKMQLLYLNSDHIPLLTISSRIT